MIYDSKFGSVNFLEESYLQKKEKIGLSLSGGLDSALILFFLCKEFQNTNRTILPIIGCDNGSTILWQTNEIILYFKENFPTVNILDEYIFHYDTKRNGGKRSFHYIEEQRLLSNNIVDLIIMGTTMNPPIDLLVSGRDTSRDTENIKVPRSENYYLPFAGVDKRFVAEMYSKFKLENLEKLTFSCISPKFDEPCLKCWWCKEKMWAFGIHVDKNVI